MPGPCACPSDSGGASPDREAGESVRLLGEGFNPLDGGMRWAAAGPRDHPVHRILLALEDGLDGAVWPVPHPAGNALLPSDPATRVPIKHALNHAVDDHPPAYHSRQITGCTNSRSRRCAGLMVIGPSLPPPPRHESKEGPARGFLEQVPFLTSGTAQRFPSSSGCGVGETWPPRSSPSCSSARLALLTAPMTTWFLAADDAFSGRSSWSTIEVGLAAFAWSSHS